MSSASLVWIASYPKSGNTWMRLFLANYLVGGAVPVPINQIHRFVLFDAATEVYRSSGLPAFDPVRDAAAAARGRRHMLGWLAGRADLTFVKTHMPRYPVEGGHPIPAELTRAAIYLVRDPRDVAISYSRHFRTTPDQAAMAMVKRETRIAPNARAVAQPIGSWSDHVSAWTDSTVAPAALVLRYEDMLAEPEDAFARAVEHLGLGLDRARLRRAVAHASFDELRRQEARHGFHEHPGLTARFFNTGKAGQWRQGPLERVARRIEHEHAAQMARFGYEPCT